MLEFRLNNIGIGDMTAFAADLLQHKEQIINIGISTSALNTYKSDAPSYKDFSKKYLQSILFNKNITFTDDENLPEYHVSQDHFLTTVVDKNVCEHFRSVFKKNNNLIGESYLVINTKVRGYPRDNFETFKNELFSRINRLRKKVVLLGEREVEINAEYEILGKNNIYSFYYDAVNLVDSSLLVDMTVPKLGLSTPDIDNLFHDMSIAYNSNASVNIGIGGFFCMSIFSGKLRALTEAYPNITNLYSFQNLDTLVKSIEATI